MEVKEEHLALEAKDLEKLRERVSYYRIGLWVSYLLILAGIIILVFIENPFVSFMIGGIGLAATVAFYIQISKVKSDLKSNTKIRISGIISNLLIEKPGCTVTYEKIPPDKVKIDVKTPSGFELYEETIVLGAGQKDLFFYTLHIGSKEIQLSRAQFFSLDKSDNIVIEISKNQEVLSLSKIK